MWRSIFQIFPKQIQLLDEESFRDIRDWKNCCCKHLSKRKLLVIITNYFIKILRNEMAHANSEKLMRIYLIENSLKKEAKKNLRIVNLTGRF